VLDLGGGTGLHAQRCLDELRAAHVDLVDISPHCLAVAAREDAGLRRRGSGTLALLEADCRFELDEQEETAHLRKGSYDIVMANGLFDHLSRGVDVWRMWNNVRPYLAPGGVFVGVRMQPGAHSDGAAADGRYGMKVLGHKIVESRCPENNRVVTRTEFGTDPPFEIENCSLKYTLDLHDLETNRPPEERMKWGEFSMPPDFVNWRVLDPSKTETVKSDPVFWEPFVKSPTFAVVTAKLGRFLPRALWYPRMRCAPTPSLETLDCCSGGATSDEEKVKLGLSDSEGVDENRRVEEGDEASDAPSPYPVGPAPNDTSDDEMED
jgi:SAM-dependent methyltransferase